MASVTQCGGSVNDQINSGRGADVVRGGDGDDVLVDGRWLGDPDTLFGDAGADVLCATEPSTVMFGASVPGADAEVLWWEAGGSLDPTSRANSASATCGDSSHLDLTICPTWSLLAEPAACGSVP